MRRRPNARRNKRRKKLNASKSRKKRP